MAINITVYDVAQIVMITVSFILHILTFYTLTVLWETDMVVFETFVYGTYFMIKLGYLVAILTDGNFTPPMEAMTKIQGAVLYNIVGLLTLMAWFHIKGGHGDTVNYLMIFKALSGLTVSGLYYAEVFQA